MGEVYLARDTKLDRQVAVKVLLPHLAADPERLRRFQQETRAVSSLNHPHILVIHDVGQFEGRAFIVTEYVEGQTLRARLRDGPLNTREVVEIAVQIASALTAAHARGIVHRDIKPENVMVRSDGYVKVLDFGIAKLLITPREHDGDDTRLRTQPGVVMGTPRYMSPEQARGLALDARTDVWSLGVLLYEMIAGRPPFDGATPADVLAAILRAEPAPLSLGATPAAKAAGRLVARTLAKNPADRFASARELHAELTALKTELDSGAGRTPAPRTVTPAASDLQHDHATAIDSLAVLPFVNAGGDPDTEYLSDGIPESLINSLSQIPDLRVVPRSTAFRYKGQDVDPKKAGRQLRVRALLMGKVLQRGDTLHVQVELVDVAKESQLWGERFNRKVADIFTVEEEIAKQISEKLRLTLSGGDRARLLKRYTENTEAYHLYLKGRYHWNKRTGEGLRKAIEYFQQAVESDPTYALAYAGLADGYCVLPFFAAVPAKGAFIRGKADALKALEIDPDLSEALTALGPLQGLLDWDWAGAERSVRRAIEVKPDYWLAHDHYALVLSALGRHAEALRAVERGLELEPLSVVVSHHVAWVSIKARQYDRAIDQCRKALELDPNFHMCSYWLGLACALKSLHDEAISALQVAQRGLGATFVTGELARACAAAGQTAEAQRLLAELHETFTQGYAEPYSFATIYAALGQPDRTFEWLETACENRSGHLAIWINGDPRLDSLTSDPRMADLLRRMGLAPVPR